MARTVQELACRFKELIRERDSEFNQSRQETSRFKQLNADAEQLIRFVPKGELPEFNRLINHP